MRAIRTVTWCARRAYAADATSEVPQATPDFLRKRWEAYFKVTTADTATAYSKPGIRPTVDVAVDTADHDFILDPVVAQMHRSLEIAKNDPFFTLYSEYLSETDPDKCEVMRKKLDAFAPVPAPSKEEVIKDYRLPYAFAQDPKEKKH